MKKKSDFEVMDQMVKANKDIKATTTITEMQMVKQGGKITFGIDKDTYHKVAKSFALGTREYLVIAYVIDRAQFEELRDNE